MKVFKSSFSLSREQIELAYSVLLLLVIPALIIANTLLIDRNIKKNFDLELQRKANMANAITGEVLKDQLDSPATLQSSLDQIVAAQPDIVDAEIMTVSAGNLTVSAAKNSDRVGTAVNSVQTAVVIDSQQAVAQLIRGRSRTQRIWRVVSPVVKDGKTVALVQLQVSLTDADKLLSNTLRQSFIVLAITTLVVIGLLANHFRFVEYAQLFTKLKEVDQLKSDFLSVATHELKAPMSIIKGDIANVVDGTFGEVNDQAKQTLETAMQQTDRLNHLVTDLLNVSRLEQGKLNYNLTDFAPGGVITPLISQYQAKAAEKNLTLTYAPPETTLNIRADSGRYQEIMTNLIDNAVKYSLHGTVTVAHEVTDTAIKTIVKDTGIGMTAAERERLFTRFYRVKNDKTKEIGGTGLGLWIIKQYIEAMHGTIAVDSMEGVGTSFTVTLPRAQE